MAQTKEIYKNCVTYPQECKNCSEGQRAYCGVGSLEMKIGDQTYRRVKGHYEAVKDGSGRETWVTWELVQTPKTKEEAEEKCDACQNNPAMNDIRDCQNCPIKWQVNDLHGDEFPESDEILYEE